MAYILEKTFKMEFTVKKIIYRNTDNFTIANVKLNKILKYKGDKPTNLDIQGYFPLCYEGDQYSANCIIKENSKYGYYLKIVDSLEPVYPAAKREIAKFIHKRTKGVGMELIKRAVDVLGLNAISIIIDEPDKLLQVQGMTSDKALKIYNSISEMKCFEELISFIQSTGMSINIASKIFKSFGKDSLGMILKNPYRICAISDIPFNKADHLAFTSGWVYDNPLRIKSAILAYLETEAAQKGSLCVEKDILLKNFNDFLDKYGVFKDCEKITNNVIEKYIDELKQNNHISTYRSRKKDQICVYKKYYFDIESSLARNIRKISRNNDVSEFPKSILTDITSKTKLTDTQLLAVKNALQNSLSVITGEPGTGKTTVINTIVKCQLRFNPKSEIILVAPTGRASRRMSELTHRKASTLHRILGIYDSEEKGKKRIKADLLIVDESSMMDAVLANTLFTSVNKECKIVLVGDVNQIEPVGVGAFFKDLIESRIVPITVLDKIFRQGSGSGILKNSKSLLNNEESSIEFNKKDFTITKRTAAEDVRAAIVEMMRRKIVNQKVSLDDVYVLTPTNEGLLGTKELNRSIQRVLNDNPACLPINDYLTFRVGDKVINKRNNPSLDVDNGDTGIIVDIDLDNISITVELFGRKKEVVFKEEDIEDLDLAYAMTVHKAQGSEFDTVIMPFVLSHSFMLNKNLIYTAWTRAKKSCHMVGTADIIHEAIQNRKVYRDTRVSCLTERLSA